MQLRWAMLTMFLLHFMCLARHRKLFDGRAAPPGESSKEVNDTDKGPVVGVQYGSASFATSPSHWSHNMLQYRDSMIDLELV